MMRWEASGLDTLEQQVDRWIAAHEEELLGDIRALVRHRSVSLRGEPGFGPGCRDALREMLSLGARYGLETEDADGLFGVLTLPGGPRTIGLWGHLDVVPEGDGWVYSPYECTRVGDFLIGRGVQDNKGPCVAALYALRCIRDLELPMRSTLRQLVGCAEETGMEDAVRYAELHPLPDYNIITDCGFPVCYGEKGMLSVRLETEAVLPPFVLDFSGGSVANIVPDSAFLALSPDGFAPSLLEAPCPPLTVERQEDRILLRAAGLAAHAAFPEGSVNAIGVLCGALLQAGLFTGKAQRLLSFVHDLCASTDGSALGIACEDGESGALTCVCGVLRFSGGRVELELNIRYPVTADASLLRSQLLQRCGQENVLVTSFTDSAPNYQDKRSVFVRTLNESFNEITGERLEPFVMGGGTYARKLPNAVAFGPGLPTELSPLALPAGHGGCHSPDEAQSIPNLLLALKIYVLSLVSLDEALEQESAGESH